MAECQGSGLPADGLPNERKGPSRKRDAAFHRRKPGSPLLIGLEGAAHQCGVSLSMFKKLERTGRIPAPIRLGSRVLWRVDELTDWVAAGCPGRSRWEAMRQPRRGGKR